MSKKTSRIVTIRSNKELLAGVHYCNDHTGKMEGIPSLSTSCLLNIFCQQRMKDGNSICAECFAAAMMKGRYKDTMQECYAENTKILTQGILDDSVIPLFPSRDGRFESFGDLNNWIQAANYIKIARKNPRTQFGWWTKNLHLIQEAIDNGYKIPKNVEIIYSSPKLNVQADASRYDFVAKVFTVYDKNFLKQHPEIVINCGARQCLACERCYVKNPKGIKVQYINEKLK